MIRVDEASGGSMSLIQTWAYGIDPYERHRIVTGGKTAVKKEIKKPKEEQQPAEVFEPWDVELQMPTARTP